MSNIITLAWVCTISTQPPLLTMSIGPRKHSVSMLKANGEFVVNLANEALMWAADRCGTTSGRDLDKWQRVRADAGEGGQGAGRRSSPSAR